MDRPPTPLFIPMKIGVDVETQIAAGDLFDFNFEVEPILEVLVGKTLEQVGPGRLLCFRYRGPTNAIIQHTS
jgi:hypothetical protein